MADDRIPTGPLEQEPTPLFLPVEDRVGLLHRLLADVRLGAWDRRIVHWLASGTDTSTLLTIVSLIQRARRAELGRLRTAAVAVSATVPVNPEDLPDAWQPFAQATEVLRQVLYLDDGEGGGW